MEAVPDDQACMLPLLLTAGDDAEHTNAATVEALAPLFGLSEEERHELIPSWRQQRTRSTGTPVPTDGGTTHRASLPVQETKWHVGPCARQGRAAPMRILHRGTRRMCDEVRTMRESARQPDESGAVGQGDGAVALPGHPLVHAAETALAALGRDAGGLRVVWSTRERAIFLQEAPAPALYLKVYQQAAQLAREVATMERAAAADIPVPTRLAFATDPPAVLITERVGGVPLSSAHPLAAEEAGRLLRRFHALGARPPFVDGQRNWSVFIREWADREIATMVERGAIRSGEGRRLHRHFAALDPVLSARPCALIHADLQAEHVLIDPVAQRVTAFLDFVDTQPGDPLIDIAVLTLWDGALTTPLLAGYGAAGHADAALLPTYRLLRHLGAANWLMAHGVSAEATRHEEVVHHYLSNPLL